MGDDTAQGEVEKLPPTAAPGSQRGQRGVDPGERICDGIATENRLADPACRHGQTGGCRGIVSERHPVCSGLLPAVARDAQPGEIGPTFEQLFGVDSELRQGPGACALDHDVGREQERPQPRSISAIAESERRAALARIQERKEGGVTEPRSVGALAALELHHPCSGE